MIVNAQPDILLKPLCEYLEAEVKKELEAQGHIVTGKLRDSIRVQVHNETTSVIIEGRGSEIAKYVDWGRRPGGKRVPIAALVGWIQLKGFATGKEAVQMAWAIQMAIWKHGIPTSGDEGKKKFITRTLERNRDRINSEIRNTLNGFFNITLTNVIREIKETDYGRTSQF